jgi:FKBP-type peptidyl-prolyl cis-trans isomerase SlyD
MTTQAAIAEGMVVSFHYTLKNDEGDILDTSSGREPLMYLHGAGNIVPGLERELAGRAVGDQVQAVVSPEDGYGVRQGPGPQAVPRARFPEDADLEEGMQVYAQGPNGDAFPLWVVDIADDHVLLDHNHPLAGVTLHFDVEVTEIRSATDEEMAHGHPHGPDGHHH